MEQIQFLLGHVSVQTAERYLGCKQRIRSAVNDRIGIAPRRTLMLRSPSAPRLVLRNLLLRGSDNVFHAEAELLQQVLKGC